MNSIKNHRKFPRFCCNTQVCRSQSARGLRRGSATARFLGLRGRIPPWRDSTLQCVLSGRFLCVGEIARPEESFRVWCVWMRSWSLNYVLSGRFLCVGEIARPKESFRVWCVWMRSWSLNYVEALIN